MLRVRLLIRSKLPGNYSIEGVFRKVVEELKNKVHFTEFILPTATSRLNSLIRVKKNSDVINHITGDVHYLALSLPTNSTIITVHDIGHYEMTLRGWKKYIYKYLWLKWPLSKARYITCISEFTKNRLVEKLNIPSSKISVIYNLIPENFVFNPKPINKLKPVILQVGSGANKNRIGLIKAVKGLTCKLILIGTLNKEQIDLLNEFQIEFDNPTNVSQSELVQYYIKADILYFASFYEGFGLPIVEAQSIGRPVITSNCAAMPEIAGNGAILVDPHSNRQIRNAIERITKEELFYADLIAAGQQNIKRFKAKQIAEEYFALYQKVKSNLT